MLGAGTCDCRDGEGPRQDEIRTDHKGASEVSHSSQEGWTEESGRQEGCNTEEKGCRNNDRGIVGAVSRFSFASGLCAERVRTVVLGVLGSGSRSLR